MIAMSETLVGSRVAVWRFTDLTFSPGTTTVTLPMRDDMFRFGLNFRL